MKKKKKKIQNKVRLRVKQLRLENNKTQEEIAKYLDLFTFSPPNIIFSIVISFLILMSTPSIMRYYKYIKNVKTDKNYQLFTLTFLSVFILTFIKL